MARTLIKITAAALIGLIAIALLVYLWLRYEFARLEPDPANYEALLSVTVDTSVASPSPSGCEQQYPDKKAWFGALHVHTGASYDATAFGVQVTPDEAYQFARGMALPLRLRGDGEDQQQPVLTISSPLDFMAVTDHAEALGSNRICYTPGAEGNDALVCKLFRGDIRLPVDEQTQPLVRLASNAIFGRAMPARVCGEDGQNCRIAGAEAWQDNRRATERWHNPDDDCRFTTFHGYEYTLAEQGSNLHRNVIFGDGPVPVEIAGAKTAPTAAQLWQWLKTVCLESDSGCDAIAIPHNSNWSGGRMWYPPSREPLSRSEQQSLAELRRELEPLTEIMQAKGDSECRNGLGTVFGAPDEFCDFEKLRPQGTAFDDCGDEKGSGNMRLQGCLSRFSYVRYALAAGLGEQARLGVNPFKLGIIAATDSHIGAPAAGLEKGHLGSHGMDREPKRRLQGEVEVPGGIATSSPVRFNPGGIAGVYAEENSRSALFAALKRRETFGTSGPRIRPRLFAGDELPDDLCEQPDAITQAYQLGVPMGGNLELHATAAPVFFASAAMDPRPGGHLLQRLQIIKSWEDSDGRIHQSVHNVAGQEEALASVDRRSCAVSGPGHRQLCSTWRDPDFDPSRPAVYYLRVLENPSCRWSWHDCLALPEDQRPPSCSDPTLPWAIQERAWTSPIWYGSP